MARLGAMFSAWPQSLGRTRLAPHLGWQCEWPPDPGPPFDRYWRCQHMAVAFRPGEILELAFAVGSEGSSGAAHLWVSGEFDLAGIPLFVQELESLQRQGREVAVLDLAQLLFIDAVGLRALLSVGERAREGGSPPALAGASPVVARVFELAGLQRRLADRP